MIPSQITDLLNSLTLTGLPETANPGDLIDLRLTPDLAPGPDGGLPPVLADLARTETLAQLDVDASALMEWLLRSIDVTSWTKDVEFEQAMDAAPAALDDPVAVKRALGHLIPKGTASALEPSTVVQGTIGRVEIAKDAAAGAVGRVTGTLAKPGLLGTPSQPKVTVRVYDETGKELQKGDGFFMSDDFVPSLVFMPPIVASRAAQPSVRRSIAVEISMQYTPPPIPNQPNTPRDVPTKTLGPFGIDIPTIELPLVGILNRHPLNDINADKIEHVFVAVPAGSAAKTLGQVIERLQSLIDVLNRVRTVLQMLNLPVPDAIGGALDVLDFLPRAINDYRFRQGDKVTLWALGHDWQWIMSAAMVIGPPTRRVRFNAGGWFHDQGAFSLRPSLLGVAFIPDLTVMPIENAPRIGTAVQEEALKKGTFDNAIETVEFPPA